MLGRFVNNSAREFNITKWAYHKVDTNDLCPTGTAETYAAFGPSVKSCSRATGTFFIPNFGKYASTKLVDT